MPRNPEGIEPTLHSNGSERPESVAETVPDGAPPDPAPEVIPAANVSSGALDQEVQDIYPHEIGGAGGGQPLPPSGDGGDGGGGDDEPHELGRMSFWDHLEELRRRIFYSLISMAVGVLVCWSYRDEIYAGLARPITKVLLDLKLDPTLVYTNPTDVFNFYIKLAMLGGVFVASPFILYQIWKFISPGLYRHEKKYALPFVLFCTLLFLSGGAFAYFVAFPAALRFLLDFSHQFRPMVTVEEYFSLASTVILGLAIVFELPILVLFLTLLRIVTPGFLLRNFRYAFLIITILAAALTPTTDIVNMLIFAAPLLGLYFIGIGLSYLVLKARGGKQES
jgi:sec-independent protein translocase protein TatC